MDGFVVIFNSPSTCADNVCMMEINSYKYDKFQPKKQVPLLTTDFKENDIFSDNIKKLQNCIEYAISNYNPKCIVVCESCISIIIGNDYSTECKKFEEIYKIPILYIRSTGFLNIVYNGYFDVIHQIVNRFCTIQDKAPNSILLMDNGMLWRDNANEFIDVFNRLGLSYLGQFSGKISFDNLKTLTKAQGIIILGERLAIKKRCFEFKESLFDKYDIKVLLNRPPISRYEMKDAILKIGEFYNLQEKAKSVWEEKELELDLIYSKYNKITKDRIVSLNINEGFHLASIDILKDILDRAGILYEENSQTKDALVITNKKEENISNNQLLIANHPIVGLSGEEKIFMSIVKALSSKLKGQVFYAR